MPNTYLKPLVKIASEPPPVCTIGFFARSVIAAVGSTMLLPNEPRKKSVPSSSWRWISVVARAGSLASSNSFSSILYFSPAISTPPSTSFR